MSSKTIYAGGKLIKCPVCNKITQHILFDYNNKIYKCAQCGNIHA